jgi:glycosyltransferase involved in cell wall biosynthesis
MGHYDLLIFDDILPSDFSPFRTLEYGHYLSFFNSALYSMEHWHSWISNDTFEACLERLPLAPELKTRISRIDDAENVTGRLGYVTFLANAYSLVEYFEIRKMPFILQLYPGGGLEVNQPSTDEKLKRVLHSPMLKKVISTQKLTRNYIIEKIGCDESKIVDIYGGVFDSRVDFDFSRNKKIYPAEKPTIDICFIAHRYVNNFSSKGYDQFVAIARALCVKHPHLRFHVVGDYSAEDIDLGPAADQTIFYGKQPGSFFADFYASMDMIISINRPFSLTPGAFDGFPTGACLEAGFRGVLNCINDPLDLNVVFTHEHDVIFLDYDTDRSISVIDALIADPARMYEIAYRNWRLFRETFSLDEQLWTRTKIIAEELVKSEALIVSPRVSWNALRELRSAMQTEIAKRDQELGIRDETINALRELRSAMQTEIAKRDQELGIRDETIKNLLSSTSWRITAAMRRVASILRAGTAAWK